MKIVVANESERKLVEYTCEYLSDSGIELLEQNDEFKNTPDGLIDGSYEFLCQMFTNPKIIVDKDIYPTVLEDSICIGVCGVCGEPLEGTFDGNDVTYDEYLDYINKSMNGELYCERCWDEA